jgi:predicted anti-sigma-YlaC factor YlaD
MDCKEIQADLSAYIDRELAPTAEERIRLHLDACEQCAADYAKILKGWQVLGAWEDVTPPERLRRTILDSVRPQRKVASLRAVLSVAAALLLIVGITVYYSAQKDRSMQDIVLRQSPVQTGAAGDISEDEIIANLLILQENDFFEALDELVMIDDLPLAEEPSNRTKEPERSSLDIVFT